MIIPIRCHTCGGVIADKYRYYLERVRLRKLSDGAAKTTTYLTKANCEKSAEGVVLDELHITRGCCRMRFLTHVDIV
jgi:DNA-directed RNA polymerase subunit N (RpoN/RPB10)